MDVEETEARNDCASEDRPTNLSRECEGVIFMSQLRVDS
jgi:hypothetical protein